ncbi:L,D-transpeptidase [Bifidobacterium simiarum]|uniref:L,D-transpeptidase n=2 Tax=Bifidobacterium simiarum TaxID=2045441 RepID=A0A2M9HGY5_9BIFI|nr:L,D-transpeptidase [Bifidobacterium simiarum]PJM76090.1 L,D-transpeptidase [Bifidobacterium simiarum]
MRISVSARRPLAFVVALLVVAAGAFATTISPTPAEAAGTQQMWRMYNPNSGEHFYTANVAERNQLCNAGWSPEGVGWVAPTGGVPVYRLYNNPKRGSGTVGDHHYTMNPYERDMLIRAGWRYEGVGWRSGGRVPLYRQYNPHVNSKRHSGAHNYTTNYAENASLVRAGWRAEGVGWYAVRAGYKAKSCTPRKTSRPKTVNWRAASGRQPNLSRYRGLGVVVNISHQKVFIQSHGRTIYTMTASTGMNNSTPRGRYTIRYRGTHFYNPSERMGGDYWVGFIGTTYLFHSVPTGVSMGSYIPSEGAKLGRPASHGCVRLSVSDAQWFYRSVPDGTPVTIL